VRGLPDVRLPHKLHRGELGLHIQENPPRGGRDCPAPLVWSRRHPQPRDPLNTVIELYLADEIEVSHRKFARYGAWSISSKHRGLG